MATLIHAYSSATAEQEASPWPSPGRRVSDKLLAAHNHAYASGNRRMASELRDILELIEGDERLTRERRSLGALDRASRWTAFVDAREAYEGAAAERDRGRMQVARLRMQMAQELWRQGEGA
jgi:hypothetical protein